MRNCDNPEHQRKASLARWAKRKKTTQERFEEKVDRIEGGCWLAKKPGATGYGSVDVDGRSVALHRASWTLHRGPIPDGACVLHKCDIRACSNPDHLYLGDRKRNRRDFMERHPEAEAIVKNWSDSGAKGVRAFWASMTPKERADFCARRAAAQAEKRRDG